MSNAFGTVTFGTFAAIIIGAIFGCLACIVGLLICCRRKLLRRIPATTQRVQREPNTVAARVAPAPTEPMYVEPIEVEPPPRYEDLPPLSGSPPPYERLTLLTLSKAKTARMAVVVQSGYLTDGSGDYTIPGTASEDKVT